MTKQVYIPEDIAPVGKKFLTDKGYDVKVGTGTDEATILREGADADGIILRTSKFTKTIIDGLPNVKVIARHGVGFDNVDLKAATADKIWVTITPLANASSVAETTLTLLLMLAKNVRNDSLQMAAGNFDYKKTHKGMDLDGKTLGILGYGKIGKMLAEKVSGLNMKVLIYDPLVHTAERGELVSREEVLSQSDFISLHLPATAETKGTIGAAEFKQMKPTAYLMNIARGSIIDEPALIEALKAGEFAGAALDVYSQEPLPLDSPLFKMDNVLLSPHIASNTNETMDRMALHVAMEVDRVLSGEKPSWPVNKI